MKKFFTLIAAVAMAASMNAQGTYAVQVGDKVNAGDQIKSVANVTLTYMEKAGTAFAVGKATDNWADADFTAYVAGKNNGKLVSEAEPTGCVYKFETKKAGSLTVAIQLNAEKGLHVLGSDFTEISLTSYNLPDAKDAASQKFTKNDKNENIVATKSNGTVTIDVAAGGTYYVLAAGTKLGFYGFKFKEGVTNGITSVNVNAASMSSEIYNLAGQQVSGSFKGLVIKNGKKFINK